MAVRPPATSANSCPDVRCLSLWPGRACSPPGRWLESAGVRRALATVACLALLCAASAPAAAHDRSIVIRLKSISVSGSVKDKPPKGLSKGDVYTGRSRLLNVVPQFGKGTGAPVGSDVSTLTLTSRTTGIVSGVAALPGGTLRFQGKGRIASNDPIPVTGGTGRFAGAHGTLVSGSGSSPLNTYRLTLP